MNALRIILKVKFSTKDAEIMITIMKINIEYTFQLRIIFSSSYLYADKFVQAIKINIIYKL